MAKRGITIHQMIKHLENLQENVKILKRELKGKTSAPENIEEYRERFSQLVNYKGKNELNERPQARHT
jgi:hypothetical protein